eukprot:m.223677 g.223677  ORF g.223677 m.223677 type:complete len:270 (-) comp17026_c9_seq4:3418-4227(-)
MSTGKRRSRWSHATNSSARLRQALSAGHLCIEVDVLQSEANVPILAHPPARVSDLSVSDLLQTIINFSEQSLAEQHTDEARILKLDFKDPNSVDPTLLLLQEFKVDLVSWEIWLNADILQGPGGRIPLFDPDDFIVKCKDYGTLSLGWTTSMYTRTFGYTLDMAEQMLQLCRKHAIARPPTFALSASYAMESHPVVIQLLTAIDKSTVTLWGAADDQVTVWIEQLQLKYSSRIHVDCHPADFSTRATFRLLRLLGVMSIPSYEHITTES